MRRLLPAALILALLAPLAAAQEEGGPRYTPELGPDYTFPQPSAPQPKGTSHEIFDVLMLFLFLVLATVLALKVRRRRWLPVLALLALFYFGFWRGGCVCPVGSVQNVTMGLGAIAYAVPLVVLAFFLLPLVFTVFFGRTFCASVCPLGAVQDVVLLKPVRVPLWLEHGLGLLVWVYLAAAVLLAATGSAYIICRYDPFVTLFRLAPIGKWAESLVRGAEPPGGTLAVAARVDLLLLTGALLVLCAFVGRAYCRFLCPYGAVLRVLSLLSKWHVTITPDECIQCRLCEDACPFGAIRKPSSGKTNRAAGRRRLIALIALLPVLIGAGAVGGYFAGRPLSNLNHTVRLAEQVRLEETDPAAGPTDASDAFRKSSQTRQELYAEALDLRGTFVVGGAIAGGFLGLVVGLKLISLSVYRTREDYVVDRAKCLSCGRCFEFCPIEKKRRGKLPAASAG